MGRELGIGSKEAAESFGYIGSHICGLGCLAGGMGLVHFSGLVTEAGLQGGGEDEDEPSGVWGCKLHRLGVNFYYTGKKCKLRSSRGFNLFIYFFQ